MPELLVVPGAHPLLQRLHELGEVVHPPTVALLLALDEEAVSAFAEKPPGRADPLGALGAVEEAETDEHLLVVQHEADVRTSRVGTVPAGRPEGLAAFGRTHAEGVGDGLVVRIEPVLLRHGRDADEEMEVVVHDAERPELDAAEAGDGDDPRKDLVLDRVVPEQHRAVGDARGDVIDAVVDGHAVLPGHFPISLSVCSPVGSRAATAPRRHLRRNRRYYAKKTRKKTNDNLTTT